MQNLELEKTMDNVVTLYGYIRDKDIFERDYQTYLSSRLLQDLSESEHAEKSMIGMITFLSTVGIKLSPPPLRFSKNLS